ncbi:hypothetical protein FSP39_005180 [Pinctada imbricata]|uniref:CCHC-type domain-containing protein n=1 Tax=Pinctada imbricata TaxID=66713 RepID=A0AA89BJJ5_PINIB|nr:hypothetical protein FSP39_018428 [Pinctada imbricata]KAK3087376.1 hypothetical protein FSP39_005180 [Pinctada imbricata]
MSDSEPRVEPDNIQPAPVRESSDAFEAFDLFKVYLDKKLGSLKKDILESSEEKSAELASKLKTEHSYKFKYSGNEKQFRFNEEVQLAISKIQRAADAKDYISVKDICADVTKLIHKRNKCIKMADKSPAGWETVREYLSDDLASDSDDDKRIRSAESRAMRSRKQRSRSNQRKRSDTAKPYSIPSGRTVSATHPNPESNFRPYRKFGAKPTDICFFCSEAGHWRKDCPKQRESNKH